MTAEFRYEHVFRAPTAEVVLQAYFEPDHLAAQDRVAGLTERTVVESHEDGSTKRQAWTVAHDKPVPLFARPFVEGGRLRYREDMTWHKADGTIDLTITPMVLGGRVSIKARYELATIAEGRVRRRYQGTVTAAVSLLSGKVERAIASAIESGMPAMFECTQRWLDEHPRDR